MTTEERTEMKRRLRMLVRHYYDMQRLRIMLGNRITANFRSRFGADIGEASDQERNKVIDTLLQEHTRLADAIAAGGGMKTITFQPTDPIASQMDFLLIGHYVELLASEQDVGKAIEKEVKTHPLWTAFLKGVKGVGAIMAAVMISELDPSKAEHRTGYWKFAGLDVGPDGKGRSKRLAHLVDVEYTNKYGETSTRKSITYNEWLKSKLMGVLADCLLIKGHYRTLYDNYRHRIEHHANWKEATKAHKHAAAKRYMVKLFLADLWLAMRKLEGLPVDESYAVGVLKLEDHHQHAAGGNQ